MSRDGGGAPVGRGFVKPESEPGRATQPRSWRRKRRRCAAARRPRRRRRIEASAAVKNTTEADRAEGSIRFPVSQEPSACRAGFATEKQRGGALSERAAHPPNKGRYGELTFP